MLSPVKFENNSLKILDQTKLPNEEIWIELKTPEDVWEAIKTLRVRGAPAIGIAAAYGLYVSLANAETTIGAKGTAPLVSEFEAIKKYLASSRPTAVNLFTALDRMEARFRAVLHETARPNGGTADTAYVLSRLLDEAEQIRIEDEKACLAMGEHGLTLIEPGMGILTHCNAGALATSGYGTCLAPVYLAHERGYGLKIFADETRPLLQGARLTAWELMREGVDVTLICDNMASIVMKQGKIDAIVVGCDRMANNGDGANKIGTSGLAILAKEYGISFYMFLPTSTIDFTIETGAEIPIEERDGEEISELWYENRMAPPAVKTYNPSFDVTDHQYITAVITEKGIIRPPYDLKRWIRDINQD